MPFSLPRICRLGIIPTITLLLLAPLIRPAKAQSTDVRFPTGVEGSEIVGVILARDIGDARLTDHFYTFNGLPGDLLITVESKNLNGDFDVFTATELRPVMKVTVYAESSTPIAKSIYLRKPESLVLRVEARSPNDDAGNYSIRFSGSFQVTNNAPSAVETGKPTISEDRQLSKSDRKTTRVSSSGARIEVPPVEVAAAPTPEPTPERTPEPTPATTTETPAADKATKTVVRKAPVRRPTRSARTRPPAKPSAPDATGSETASKQESPAESPASPPAKTETGTPATDKPSSAASAETPVTAGTDKKPSSGSRASGRTGRAATRATKTAPPAENTSRLVIEEKNGTRIEYLMSMIRKVTVEEGQLVVVRSDGYVERIAMSQVARMSIGP